MQSESFDERVSQPEAAVLVQPRKHVSAPVAVWFYTDSDSPSIRKEAEARCETIFTHFMLGCDVRGFVELDSRDQARTHHARELHRPAAPLDESPRGSLGARADLGPTPDQNTECRNPALAAGFSLFTGSILLCIAAPGPRSSGLPGPLETGLTLRVAGDLCVYELGEGAFAPIC